MSSNECSSPFSSAFFCKCSYPDIVYPGICNSCNFTHDVANRMVYRAIQIPFRFFSEGKITWRQQEDLADDIDCIVWRLYNEVKGRSRIGQQSQLCLFQEKVLSRVKDLLQRHNPSLQMSEIDEKIFKIIDPEAVCRAKLY
jgi:hypothetical protein